MRVLFALVFDRAVAYILALFHPQRDLFVTTRTGRGLATPQTFRIPIHSESFYLNLLNLSISSIHRTSTIGDLRSPARPPNYERLTDGTLAHVHRIAESLLLIVGLAGAGDLARSICGWRRQMGGSRDLRARRWRFAYLSLAKFAASAQSEDYPASSGG